MKNVIKLFYYQPVTGILFWRERPCSDFKTKSAAKTWNSRFANKPAGYKSNQGDCYYIKVQVNGRNYFAHRIIAKMLDMPEGLIIDHINGDGTDNRECNLRPVSRSINNKNKSRYSRNSSGCLGVYFSSRSKKWISTIHSDGKKKCLGSFSTKEEAINARVKAEPIYGYTERHGSDL